MAFNQFTNLDFNDIREQIKDYLRSNSNFTDFDFEGSNFSILIDTLAYNSYITAYNTNMAVNESFIDSATLRENVVSLARNIGYVPRSRKAATARVTFSAAVNARSVTLKKGVVALGGASNGNYIFSIPEDGPAEDSLMVHDSISSLFVLPANRYQSLQSPSDNASGQQGAKFEWHPKTWKMYFGEPYCKW